MNQPLAPGQARGTDSLPAGVPRPPVAAMARWALAIAAFGSSMLLFHPFSDGSFVVFDGARHGEIAEQTPLRSIEGHHPLFHWVVLAVAWLLEQAAIDHPAHIAQRMITGICLAAAVLLISGGARMRSFGVLFAAVFCASRVVIVSAAGGDNVIAGALAGLVLFFVASRPRVGAAAVAGALCVVLLARQDNILIVPGVVMLLRDRPMPWPWRRIGTVLAVAGGVVIAGYVASWYVATSGGLSFWTYLVFLARDGPWTGETVPRAAQIVTHVDSLSAALIGRDWDHAVVRLAPAAGYAAAMLLAIAAACSIRRHAALWSAAATVLVLRAGFFIWFEATNPEWWIFPMGLLALVGSMTVRRSARFSVRGRAGATVLAGLAALVLVSHAGATWSLRQRTFMGAVQHALSLRDGARVVALGPYVHVALEMLRVPHVKVEDRDDPETALSDVMAELGRDPGPALVIIDRWIVDGTPYGMRTQRKAPIFIDALDDLPHLTPIRWQGLVFAARVTPAR